MLHLPVIFSADKLFFLWQLSFFFSCSPWERSQGSQLWPTSLLVECTLIVGSLHELEARGQPRDSSLCSYLRPCSKKFISAPLCGQDAGCLNVARGMIFGRSFSLNKRGVPPTIRLKLRTDSTNS